MAELPAEPALALLGRADSPEGLGDCRSKRAGERACACLPGTPGAAGSSGPCQAASWPGVVGPWLPDSAASRGRAWLRLSQAVTPSAWPKERRGGRERDSALTHTPGWGLTELEAGVAPGSWLLWRTWGHGGLTVVVGRPVSGGLGWAPQPVRTSPGGRWLPVPRGPSLWPPSLSVLEPRHV